jgi:hypothetical protein
MFALTDADLGKRIFGCADGPASFNAELTARGGSIVSCDPIYEFTADEIRQRIDATYPQMLEQAAQNTDEFVWTRIPHLTSHTLAHDLRQALQYKGFYAIHAKLTGKPNG